jgi:hypothetical protein
MIDSQSGNIDERACVPQLRWDVRCNAVTTKLDESAAGYDSLHSDNSIAMAGHRCAIVPALDRMIDEWEAYG